jgi:hypothetical protein
MEEFHKQYADHNFNVLGNSADFEYIKVEDLDTSTVDIYKKVDSEYVWHGFAKNWDPSDMNILTV